MAGLHLLSLFLLLLLSAADVRGDIRADGNRGRGRHPLKPCPPCAPAELHFVNDKQRQAYDVIQRFKSTLTGDPNGVRCSWNGPLVCKYKGFYCDSPPNSPNTPTVAAVDFNGFKLSAPTLAGFIDQLPDLAFFHGNSNNFSGVVPDLSHLPFFYELDVSNNLIAMDFPSSVTKIRNLTFLDLRFNDFNGGIDSSVFELGKLEALFLNNNGFDEAIPSTFGRTAARYITLAANTLTGSIPGTIGDAGGTLEEFLCPQNLISGCLPSELGLLKKARIFGASRNNITGEIPRSLGCLEKVEELVLGNNQLFGELPDEVCRLPRLLNLSIPSNYLTSLGPSCYKLLHSGRLDVRNNCIPDCADQRPPEDCGRFLSGSLTHCPDRDRVPCKC